MSKAKEGTAFFDEEVKRFKAAEWLVLNDPVCHYAVQVSSQSAASAILMAAAFGGMMASKIDQVSKRMEVTDRDRRYGYPAMTDDEIARLAAFHLLSGPL